LCSSEIHPSLNSARFIAIGASDVAKMARFVSMATAALLSGKVFRMAIAPTSAGGGFGVPANVAGCAAADCRTPSGFTLVL
jgi:hypothetical protein